MTLSIFTDRKGANAESGHGWKEGSETVELSFIAAGTDDDLPYMTRPSDKEWQRLALLSDVDLVLTSKNTGQVIVSKNTGNIVLTGAGQ